MRPVDKSLFTGNQSQYTPYGDAKDDLILALGDYCSYCERQGYSASLDVEHIHDKDTHPDQKDDWDNFLLACKNCNPIKGTKQIEDSYMPHIHDTYHTLSYVESGFVIVHPGITDGEEKKRVQQLINLVGLDRLPGHPKFSPKDKRWQERKKAWELATKYLQKFEEGRCESDTIIDLAQSWGYWSIWMTLFDSHHEITEKLIVAFPGTNREFFSH